MRKQILLLTLFVAVTFFSSAQQDPQFSQNMHNRLFPNPGVAGSNGAICATLIGRHQWVGFEGNPETYVFSVHSPVRVLRGGVGLSILSDQLGQENGVGAKAAYAFRYDIGVGTLGMGVAAGVLNKALLGFSTGDADTDPNQDPTIPTNGVSDFAFDLDLGLYYETDRLYLGVSSTHIPQSSLKDIAGGNSTDGYKLLRHYYIMAGYNYQINQDFVIQPSLLVKSDASVTQMGLNCNVIYNNMIWGGVSYRGVIQDNDAISPMVGLLYPVGPGDLKFGYSYDLTISKLKTYQTGTHEIMLGYCFKLPEKIKVQKHKTVRFL